MKKLLLVLISISIFAEAPSIQGCNPRITKHFYTLDTSIVDGANNEYVINFSNSAPSEKIIDVDFSTDISHTFTSDLEISLMSPSGTNVKLSTDNGGSFDNVFSAVEFDDQAILSVVNDQYLNGVSIGKVTPEEPLSKFIGENPNGNWKLLIRDDTLSDTGGVLDGLLTITTCQNTIGSSAMVSFSNSTSQNIPDNSFNGVNSEITVDNAPLSLCSLSVKTSLSHNASNQLRITLTSPWGTKIKLVDPLLTIAVVNSYSNTSWTDLANNPISDVVPTGNISSASPLQAFAKFNGIDPNGKWVLNVSDNYSSTAGTLNSWELTLRGCDKDTDLDGIGNIFDQCISDPAKTVPGTCGCGIPDVDANSNGIYDCQKNQEIKQAATSLIAIYSGIKAPLNTAEKASLVQLRSKINLLKSYINSLPEKPRLKEGASYKALLLAIDTNYNKFKRNANSANKFALSQAILKLVSSVL